MPAAGESSSLYKIIKNDESASQDRFRPHLFQKMDVDKPSTDPGEAEKGTNFEPLDLNGNCSASPASEVEPVEDENLLEDLQRSAYADGFVKGEKSGTEAEKIRLKTVFGAFGDAVEKLKEIRGDLYLNAERGAVELALAIAEKVISHEVSLNKETVLDVLKAALGKITDQEKIRIRINTADLQLINESGYQVSGLNVNVKDMAIEGDDTISRGGCVIETGFGSIDARIESQLQAVEDLLRSEMP